MTLGLVLLGSFFLGSLPFGLWIARTRGVDIRRVGSGNIGATNVHRTLGKTWGILVFALDLLKGLVPTLVARQMFHDQQLAGLAGFVAVLGHCFSPLLRFKGGKGISTGLGALLGATPFVGLGAIVAFAVFLWRTQYVSLSSLVAAFALVPLGLISRDPPIMVVFYFIFFVFVVYRHRSNIERLRAGTENKFTWKRTVEPSEAT